MSPILGDALTNSRWWLTSQRRSLYSDDDYPQPATSSTLLDRGDEFKEDEFEDSDSMRLVRQQFFACCPLLPEGHRDKIRRKIGSLILAVLGRLRACPFMGTWRALLCGEVMRVGAAGYDMQRFWGNR